MDSSSNCMSDYGSYTTTGKSRFGYRSGSWDTLTETRTNPWAKSDIFNKKDPTRDHVCRPVIIGSDGRTIPVVVDCPPKQNKKGTTTSVEESACRVQPTKPYANDYVPGNRKMGFPSGMFQRLKSETALISDDGWTRPSLKGWKLPPEEPLQKVPDNRYSDFIKCSAQPNSDSGWAGLGSKGRLEKVTNSIDKAAEYVRGPVGPTLSVGGRRWGPARVATIDSREAKKKYGGRYV